MSNPTLKDGGAAAVLISIKIDLHKDGAVIIETNAHDPVVFAQIMGNALAIKMNQFMEAVKARVELAKMQHPLRTLVLPQHPKGD